jgi:hypothetical protein
MDYSFIEVMLAFILGCVISARITNTWNRQVFREILRDLGIKDSDLFDLAKKNGMLLDIDEELPEDSTVVAVKLEQHDGQIYAFRKDTDQFLGQGQDADSLIKRLTENLNPCRVIVAKEDGADLLKNPDTI